jgi:hypothetical protein
VTQVTLRSTANGAFDHVRLCLEYDPQALRPLQVSDHKFRRFLAEMASLTSDLRAGWICYQATLAHPHKGQSVEMITVEWEARVPGARTRIVLGMEGEEGTAVTLGGRNLLGRRSDPEDGTLGTDVSIRPAGEQGLVGALLLEGGVRPEGEAPVSSGVGLRLLGPGRAVEVGEQVEINVVLENPGGASIDEIVVALTFDPEVFEPVDAAPGGRPSSSTNWIVRGINLLDAPFHEEYPFDLHLRNEVTGGRAVYHMGLMRAQALPSGVLARLVLRALRPARETAVAFAPETAVQMQGGRLLGSDLPGVALSVAAE